MGYTLLLVLVCIVDVINLCRNISDGVRPFIPPCSLVSLYAFTKISYLSLPSSMFGISSMLEIHSSLSCYMLLSFPETVDSEFGIRLSLIWLCTRKCLNILDVNCFPLSCITLSGLPLIIIQSSSTLRTSTDLFLSDHLLATFLEQSSRQLMM